MSVTFITIYDEYIIAREKFNSSHRFTFKGMINRTLFPKSEYLKLAELEGNFRDDFFSWLSGIFELHNVKADSAEKYKADAKIFKEEITYRNSFLLLYATLISSVISILGFFLSSEKNWHYFLALVGLIIIFTLIERIRSLPYISAAEDISIHIECWIKLNSSKK